MEILNYAQDVFTHILLNTEDGTDTMTHLMERGFKEQTIKEFGFGRTASKDELSKAILHENPLNLEALIKLGLGQVVPTKDNNVKVEDFFKGRFTLPIHNNNGVLVGFAGRTLPHNTHPAKYLNSPENEVFQKRNILYNFHRAKKDIQAKKYVVLMEGYLDVAMAWQHEITNVVGTMGTALTAENIQKLKRIVKNVIIMYDGDLAGMESAKKNAELLIEQGFNVRIVAIPNNHDPHELLQLQGIEGFKSCMGNALGLFDFTLLYTRKKYDLTVEANRIFFLEEILQSLQYEELDKQRSIFAQLSYECGFNSDHANHYLTQMYGY